MVRVDVECRAKSREKPRRVGVVVQERKDDLFLHQVVLITNASKDAWPAENLVEDYCQRGTMEGRIGELRSVLMPALSCTQRRDDRATRDASEVELGNAATLALFAMAYNLAHSARLVFVRANKYPCASRAGAFRAGNGDGFRDWICGGRWICWENTGRDHAA